MLQTIHCLPACSFLPCLPARTCSFLHASPSSSSRLDTTKNAALPRRGSTRKALAMAGSAARRAAEEHKRGSYILE